MQALPQDAAARAKKAREQIAAMQAGDGSNASRSDEPKAPPEPSAPVEQVAPTPAPEPVATPEPPVTAPKDEREPIKRTDWKSRYELLRASRDDKRTRAEAERDAALARLAELNQGRKEPQAPSSEQPSRFELGEKDREYLGETEADVLDRLAKHTDSRLDAIQQESQAQLARRQERMFEDLDSIVPDWRSFDEHVGFNVWLDASDEATGVIRRSALNGFLQDFDSAGVARLIQLYKASEAAPAADQQAPVPAAPVASPEPESHRAAPAQEAERMVEMWTAAEIKAHYAEKHRLERLGKFKGEAREQIEQRGKAIELALRENRVIHD